MKHTKNYTNGLFSKTISNYCQFVKDTSKNEIILVASFDDGHYLKCEYEILKARGFELVGVKVHGRRGNQKTNTVESYTFKAQDDRYQYIKLEINAEQAKKRMTMDGFNAKGLRPYLSGTVVYNNNRGKFTLSPLYDLENLDLLD